MKMYLKIENGVIEDVKFKTFGCGAAIATSSIVTTIVIVIGVVACVGIMIYAANNSKNEHSETDNVPVVSDVPEILTTEAEEDSSEELTTIATTAPTTEVTTSPVA